MTTRTEPDWLLIGEMAEIAASLDPAPLDATPAEVDAVLQAQTVHTLIRCDPAMPARLRAMLVAYASLMLDRDERTVAVTPAGLAALADVQAAGTA